MNVSKAIFLKMEKESPKVKYNIINLVDELSTDYCKVFTVQNNANNKLHIMYSYLKTKSDKDNSYIFQEAFILSNYTHENMTRLFNFYEGIDN